MSRRVPLSLWALLASVVLSSACASKAEAPQAPPAPDLPALERLLAPHAAHRFDAAAVSRGCPAQATLGEYLGTLRTYGTGTSPDSDPSDRVSYQGRCLPLDAARWDCRLESSVLDAAGESPWRYELHLRLDRESHRIDLTSFACPGAP